MSAVEERLDKVVERLGSVEERLGSVEGRLGSVEQSVQDLRGDVQKLRVLGEENASEIKKVAEVQAHHGKKLDEITRALEPLAAIDAFVKSVAHDHEHRIKALEERARIRPQ